MKLHYGKQKTAIPNSNPAEKDYGVAETVQMTGHGFGATLIVEPSAIDVVAEFNHMLGKAPYSHRRYVFVIDGVHDKIIRSKTVFTFAEFGWTHVQCYSQNGKTIIDRKSSKNNKISLAFSLSLELYYLYYVIKTNT